MEKEIRGTCKPRLREPIACYADTCYLKPSRYHVWRKAREAREFWNDLTWYAQRDRKHEKPEPKKNRPYYRALENKKWRF